jgi:hypothetical protein
VSGTGRWRSSGARRDGPTGEFWGVAEDGLTGSDRGRDAALDFTGRDDGGCPGARRRRVLRGATAGAPGRNGGCSGRGIGGGLRARWCCSMGIEERGWERGK